MEGGKYRELAITSHKQIQNADGCGQAAVHLIGRPIKMQMITDEEEQQGASTGQLEGKL